MQNGLSKTEDERENNNRKYNKIYNKIANVSNSSTILSGNDSKMDCGF